MSTLMDSLKAAIHERHARLDKLPFVNALTQGELPLNNYVAQLSVLSIIHGALEHELRYAPLPTIQALYQTRPSRLAHLREDLSVFDRLSLPSCLKAVECALGLAEWIRRTRLECPEKLVGFFYVMEGTTLGNKVHLPDLEKTFGDRIKGAANYYAGYGDKTGTYWKAFRSTVNALPLDNDGREQLSELVNSFFDQMELLYSALYPVEEKGWGYTASMLNPEAGNHPVPGRKEEIEAAVIAARRCREEFPYFDSRYGERGRSFAKSDAAWLVTLTALPQSHLISQVEWLGRVLGNRGMPRITLERQLELLHEELTSAIPESGKAYQGLLEAARFLKSERLQVMPGATFGELVRRFDMNTCDGQNEKLFKIGELIVSSVCDEAAGITEAVNSLVSWLTDPQRFSGEWIAEVSNITALARAGVIRR